MSVAPILFNDDKFEETSNKKNLRIGYFEELPSLPSTYSVKRSIKIAKEALEKKGHKLVPFNLTEEEYKTFKLLFF